MKTRQTGFTLVEIAIVLVIIGLLLGGILKGQEMITQAKIKNVINDLNGVTAALNSYQDRYRALPGDDKGAAARWPNITPTAVVSGDGDGVISGTYVPSGPTIESAQFWLHLRQAGFVAGTSADNPFNAVSGKMGVQTGNGPVAATSPTAVMATAGGAAGFTGLILCSANLPDKMAISVDAQVDDGNAQTGSVRGVDQVGAPNPTVPALLTTGYVEDGTKSYLVCQKML
jgi:prepilin-type N-terminal cleavage/methylation domain-containing protein